MEHLYWIVMLDNIKLFCVLCFAICAVCCLICGVVFGANSGFTDTDSMKNKRVSLMLAKFLIPAIFVFGIGLTFIPSTKQLIAIITIPKIVNNEQIQEMPDNALKLINSKLKEWAEDTEILPRETNEKTN